MRNRYSNDEIIRARTRLDLQTQCWEFLFLGANIEATAEARRFGIDASRAANYNCDEEGTALNFDVISEAVCAVRACATLSDSWKERIDEDYRKRKSNR